MMHHCLKERCAISCCFLSCTFEWFCCTKFDCPAHEWWSWNIRIDHFYSVITRSYSLLWVLCFKKAALIVHVKEFDDVFLMWYILLYLQVASFPFDDHNCPPIHLIKSFCQSAYSWLKEDIENVVVVHCKAGMARTGLMISSLLLYLKVGCCIVCFMRRVLWVCRKCIVLLYLVRFVRFLIC